MSFREEKIKEITEALQNVSDSVLSSFYAIIILAAQFSERPIDLEKVEEEKKEKKAVPVKKEKVAKPSSRPAEMDFDDLNEDMPKPKGRRIKEEEDNLDLIADDDEFEELKPAKKEKATPKKEEKKIEDNFDVDFDADFDSIEKEEPKKEEPVKEEEPKKEEPKKESKKEEPKKESKKDEFDEFEEFVF